jgi:site-specific recombinase XerD
MRAENLSEKAIWQLVQIYSEGAGLPKLAPHDCRRSYAKLCLAAGGELDQIQILLGHASIVTAESYLGRKQDPVHAPNDGIKLKVSL